MSNTVSELEQPRGELIWPDFPLGIGTGRLCSLNGGLSIRRAAWFLNQAFKLGVRFIDTAPTYGQGHVECAIGRLAPEVRNQFTICSKVGYSFGRKTKLINAAKPLLRPILPWANSLRRTIASARHRANSASKSRLSIEPAVIRSVLEESLQRIQRDWLDLLLLHDPSIESVDNSANQDVLSALVQSGKIRGWGVSTSNPDVVERAINTAGCSVVQFPMCREWVDVNPHIVQKCVDGGVSIIANSVLSTLSQQRNGNISDAQFTTAEQCLSFALGQPGVRIVLCGTRNLSHLSQNVETIRRLSPR